MTLVLSIFVGAWEMLLVAAPFLLFGMLLAGVLHVVLSRRWIERLMGRRGLLGVITAAGFGVPLPLCSCSVVPVVLALRRKGASAPASLSFLKRARVGRGFDHADLGHARAGHGDRPTTRELPYRLVGRCSHDCRRSEG